MKDYSIRKDYVSHRQTVTLDAEGRVYWDRKRIDESAFYQWHVYRYAQELIRRNRIERVLDIGCGAATKLVGMLSPFAEVCGIDQPSAIDYCRAAYKVGTFYADNLEAPNASIGLSFELIICSDVIEHVVDPDTLLAYIKKFCNQQTYILFSTPDREKLRGKNCLISPKKEHIREWTADEFSAYLESSGFSVLDCRHLPPVKTAFNRLFWRHFWGQVKKGRPYRYNLLTLCRLKAD